VFSPGGSGGLIDPGPVWQEGLNWIETKWIGLKSIEKDALQSAAST
jgi:hypothetical protein